MPGEFQCDVFPSHSAKDNHVVRAVAERLPVAVRKHLRVWLDELEIKAGDSIPAKIEEGLEHSRVLACPAEAPARKRTCPAIASARRRMLCMSANAFGSDWAQLEAGTFRFRDPLNKDRRFIHLRLDETPIKDSLAQFLYISWLPQDHEQEYAKLLNACRGNVQFDSAREPTGKS